MDGPMDQCDHCILSYHFAIYFCVRWTAPHVCDILNIFLNSDHHYCCFNVP